MKTSSNIYNPIYKKYLLMDNITSSCLSLRVASRHCLGIDGKLMLRRSDVIVHSFRSF